jgi:hypothetical protein
MPTSPNLDVLARNRQRVARAQKARLDDVLVRRGAGARRGVRLDSRQPSFTEVLKAE